MQSAVLRVRTTLEVNFVTFNKKKKLIAQAFRVERECSVLFTSKMLHDLVGW